MSHKDYSSDSCFPFCSNSTEDAQDFTSIKTYCTTNRIGDGTTTEFLF